MKESLNSLCIDLGVDSLCQKAQWTIGPNNFQKILTNLQFQTDQDHLGGGNRTKSWNRYDNKVPIKTWLYSYSTTRCASMQDFSIGTSFLKRFRLCVRFLPQMVLTCLKLTNVHRPQYRLVYLQFLAGGRSFGKISCCFSGSCRSTRRTKLRRDIFWNHCLKGLRRGSLLRKVIENRE